MIGRILGLDKLGRVTDLSLYFRHPWPLLVAVGLIGVAAVATGVLYRRERGLSRGQRVLLGVFRVVLYGILILLLFEPVLTVERSVELRKSVLVLVDSSESMGIHDERKSRAELEEAALALGLQPFDRTSFALSAEAKNTIRKATRLGLAKALLDHPELDAFDRLAREHRLRLFRFGSGLEPLGQERDAALGSTADLEATDKATHVGAAISEAVGRYGGGESVAAVILLTDGASNGGLEPLEVARRLKKQGIPLFPIGLGLPRQPDVRIQTIVAQENVFAGDRLPVRVELESLGFPGRTVDLVATLSGREVARRAVRLRDGGQFAELTVAPEVAGQSLRLQVSIDPLPGETAVANNTAGQPLEVIDDKIHVLYVEGRPRWEYRYLRAVLLRDHRLDVKFLMTQGDRDLARASDRYLATFPETTGEVFPFDLVILGDVPASYFSARQLARMEELVRQHGGSLLMLAGARHAPASYVGTAIKDVLPVRLRPEAAERVGDLVHPVVTEAGQKSAVVSLERDADRNAALWSLVRPLYQLARLDGTKPAATVLASLSGTPWRGDEPYPLIAWHRYGTGKCLFVATDQLWRLRFKRGDKYHARFWGQTIQFLTLGRLLGENKQIRLEIDRKDDYRTGERVHVYANVLQESYEPLTAAGYTVRVDLLGDNPISKDLRLQPVDGSPGLYQGFFPVTEKGRYRLRTHSGDTQRANVVQFDVVEVPLEELEGSMQEQTLRKMAHFSGGRYVPIRELPNLPGAISTERDIAPDRRDKELWDLPLIFIVLLACAALEWALRRRYDLI